MTMWLRKATSANVMVGPFVDFSNAMNFDAFDPAKANNKTSYTENSLTLSSNGIILRDDALSASVKAQNGGQTFTLTEQSGGGLVDSVLTLDRQAAGNIVADVGDSPEFAAGARIDRRNGTDGSGEIHPLLVVVAPKPRSPEWRVRIGTAEVSSLA